MTIYACYWSPNTDYILFVDFLDRLEGCIRNKKGMVIVTGDFNAKSPAWGDHREDQKGKTLMDMMVSLEMVVCNSGDKPTFTRVYDGGISRSHIDITFVSETESRVVKDWKVSDEYTGSLHSYIYFNISWTSHADHIPVVERWSWRKLDRSKLLNFIERTHFEPGTEALSTTDALNRYLKDACDSCMPKGNYWAGKNLAYWCGPRKYPTCVMSTRGLGASYRHRLAETQEQARDNFKQTKKNLKALFIRQSKEKCWKDLCDQVETDPWGLPYKVVTKTLVGRRPIPGLTLPGRVDSIIDGLFPRKEPTAWPPWSGHHVFPEVTCDEIIEASRKIPSGKAPGPDGVPDMIIKTVAVKKPIILRDTLILV